ncbi:MAG: sulfatase, partial [Acidobacteriota bacterium]
MASLASGLLQDFFAYAETPIASERSVELADASCEHFASYRVDLRGRLGPAAGSEPLRLRVDPIDQKAPVTLQAVTFRQNLRPEDPEPEGPDRADLGVIAGKVRLGPEVRAAFQMRAPARLTRTASWSREGSRLLFDLSPARGNPSALGLRVSAAGERVFEHRFEAGEALGFREFAVPLGPCPQAPCEVLFEVAAAASEVAGGPGEATVFLASPAVVGPLDAAAQPNIILISLDTLSAGEPSFAGGPRGSTPFLDRLASEGVRFERAYAASSTTHTSHASMLTGLAPLETSFFWLNGKLGDEQTLASRLRRAGYQTAAFTAGVLVSESLRFDRGFDSFYQHDTLYRPIEEHSDIEPITERAAAWVERHAGSPFFLFVHSYEVHGPYVTRDGAPVESRKPGEVIGYNLQHMRGGLPLGPDQLPSHLFARTRQRQISFGEAGLEPDIEPIQDAYRQEIRALDAALEAFFARLDATGALDGALVIVTSDHGEAFLEHGVVEHGLLYDVNLRVPLLMHAPGSLPAGARVSSLVSSVDLAATALEWAGLEVEGAAADSADALSGRSLLAHARGETEVDHDFYSLVLGNGLSLYQGGRSKWIERAALAQDNFGRHQLFDLVDDPGELRDLRKEGAEMPRALKKQLRDAIDLFPGLHLDLAPLAGRPWHLELFTESSPRDNVYAFGVERSALDRSDPKVLKVLLEPGERGRLVYRTGLLKNLRLTLESAEGERFDFSFKPPDQPGQRRQIQADRGGPTLSVWRVSKASAPEGGFSEEDQDKLRSLGYIQ